MGSTEEIRSISGAADEQCAKVENDTGYVILIICSHGHGYDNKSSELHERGAQQSKLESLMNCDLTRVYFSRPSKRLCPKVDTSSTLSHTVHHDLAC